MANLKNTVVTGSLRLASHGAGIVRTSANGTISTAAMTAGDLPSHNHDDRYYTESEINSLLSGKQDAATAITTSNIGSYAMLSSGGTLSGTLTIGTAGSTSQTRALRIVNTGANPSSFGSYAGSWRSALEIWDNNSATMLFLTSPDGSNYNYSIIKSVGAGLVIDVGSSGATNAITISTAGVVNAPQGLQVGGNSVVSTAGGQTIAGTTYFSGGESLNLYGIRGRFANEYIHLYNKVGIGHPSGWGQGEGNTPGYGLSTYGGVVIAYGNNATSQFQGHLRIDRNWGLGDYGAEQFTIRGTHPSIALRSTHNNNVWLIHNDDTVSFYYGGGVDSNNWSRRFFIPTDGNIWMSWAGDYISNLLAAKQNASTAITTSNIGSQSVSYASSAGNSDTTSQRDFNYLSTRQINQGSFRTYHVGTFSAAGTQARRFLIGKIGIDYNDWNSVGLFEVEIAEQYFSAGQRKRYVVNYGYGSVNSIHLVESNGIGSNNADVVIEGPTQISGDHYVLSVYVRVKYYATYTCLVRTTRSASTSNPPGIGQATVFTDSSAENIADFSVDSTVYLTSGTSGIAATAFYDSQDTGYYVDPNSTSNLAASYIGRVLINYDGTDTWFRMQSGNRMRVTTTGGNDFIIPNTGNITFNGTTLATREWVQSQGYRTTDSDNQTLSVSGTTLTISGGNSVTLPTGGISQGDADARYLRYTGAELVEGNYFYFRSNRGSYLGGLDSATLQVYATGGNSAFMSFHRSGSYAVNFGLDADNQMRIGGWSAASNRWVLDMDGNNTVAGSFRAPIFYDSNDTTYYMDYNSTTSGVLRGNLIFNDYGAGVVGTYTSTRYQGVFAMGNAYKLPIDGTSTGNLYGIAWTHTNVGGQSKSGLDHQALFMMNGITQTAIGTGIWTNGLITTTSHGTSANWNTAYGWGNHASAGYQAASTAITTSNIGSQSVNYAGSAGNADTVDGYHESAFWRNGQDRTIGVLRFSGEGGNSGNAAHAYAIFQEGGDWSHPYPDLRIAFHTGIKLGAHSSYNGIRFYTDYDMSGQVMSVNNGSDPLGGGNVYVNNSLQAGSSLRAPIFYDSDNTAYYLDPNSTTSAIFRGSVGLNNTSPINSNWGNASNTTQLSIYGSNYGLINLRGDNGGTARTFSMGVGDQQFYMCYDNTAGRHNITVNSSGHVSIAVDVRAPIFYDSNDTNYYLDPNSAGTALRINGGIVSTAGNGAVLLKHENSEANAWIFRENAANWGLFWFNAGSQSGQTIGSYTTVGAELFGMNNAVTGFNPNSAWSGTDSSTRAAWMLSNYSGYLWTQGTQYSQTDMRAPIFYDSANTGYYGDFASTSRMNIIRADKVRGDTNGDMGSSGWWAHDPYGYGWGQPHGSFRSLEVSSSGNFSTEPAMFRIHQWGSGAAEFWKPQGTILYLRETPGGGSSWFTKFEVQGSLQSNNLLFPNGFQITQGGSNYGVFNSWVRLDGHYGFYSGTNSAHLYPNNNSYGAWKISGERNGWRGLHFGEGTGITLMMNEGEFGFHREGVGWVGRFTSGTGHFNISGNATTATTATTANVSKKIQSDYQEWDFGWGSHTVTTPMSISIWDNYTQGGAPSGYGTIVDMYGLSGHQQDQFYFYQGNILHRYGWYGNNNWNGWYNVLTSNSHPYPSNMNQYVRTSDAPTFNGIYTNDWFRANGCTGLYFQSYGYGLRAPECEGNSYGNVATYGTGRNGWSGYGIGSQFVIMGRVGTDLGLHDNNYGWGWYWHTGNRSLGIGESTTSSSYKLYVTGAIYATGDIVAFSDKRKKTDIITIEDALSKVKDMRGVFYTKIDEAHKGRQVGVIAQEMNEVLPEAVTYAADVDEYGVKYGNIVGVLIEAIKEQQKQIEELKAKLA